MNSYHKKNFGGPSEYSTAVEYSMNIVLFVKLAIFAILRPFSPKFKNFKVNIWLFYQ